MTGNKSNSSVLRGIENATGFTLIELGVVLAVIAVMAGAVMADVVEIAKNRAAQNTATEIVRIQQAAKDFYHDTMIDQNDPNKKVDPDLAHWPGESKSAAGHWQSCGAGGSLSESTSKILAELTPYFGSSFSGKNVWGKTYSMGLVQSSDHAWKDIGTSVWGCGFFVATDVPTEVAGVITTFLPSGVCNDPFCGDLEEESEGSDGAAFARCCAMIPRPGMEASLAQAKNSLDFWVEDFVKKHGATLPATEDPDPVAPPPKPLPYDPTDPTSPIEKIPVME